MTNMYRSKRTNAALNQNNAKGGILIGLGALSSVSFLATIVINLIMKFGRWIGSSFGFRGINIPAGFSLILLLVGICLISLGASTIALGSRYKKLQLELDAVQTDSLVNLAGRIGNTPDKLLDDIVRMQRKNFWKAVTILENAIVIEPFEQGVAYRILAEESMEFSQRQKRGHLPFPLVIMILVGIALILPVPWWLNLLVSIAAALVSIPLTAATAVFYKPTAAPVYASVKQKAPVTIEIEKSSDTNVNEVIAKGEGYLNRFAALQSNIKNTSITGDIYDITASLRQLLELLKEEPNKIKPVQQLMNYSLPTTVKLLEDYENLSNQPVKGENIQASMKKIEEMSSMVANTFRKELDTLYQDRTLNIEVDIEVMESMLNQNDMDITKF